MHEQKWNFFNANGNKHEEYGDSKDNWMSLLLNQWEVSTEFDSVEVTWLKHGWWVINWKKGVQFSNISTFFRFFWWLLGLYNICSKCLARSQPTSNPIYLTLFHLACCMQKEVKLKELSKRKSWKKKSWPSSPTEVELLLGLIDIKVVSRVLRMPKISKEQLLWCEEKMSMVDLSDKKLRRDGSPILFPCWLKNAGWK